MRLDELHYKDLFPKGFEKFRSKYGKVVRNGSSYSLYVQFTSGPDNTLDKRANPNPDHHDPVGVYAYPLDYVIKYPVDVWYGAHAKYLRVLRSTAKKPLYLDGLTWDKCVNVLTATGLFRGWYAAEAAMKVAKREFRHTGKNAPAKSMMSVIQLDMTGEKSGDRPVRSGAEQTRLFIAAGYDALIDTARGSRSAVINSREPEQICFLTRGAFEVVDVFFLREKSEGPMTVHEPDWKFYRRLAAMAAEGIDDVLASDGPRQGETSNLGGWHYFWTRGGRRVRVLIERPSEYYDNRRIGEKIHKYERLYTNHNVKVEIDTERGVIQAWQLDDKDRISELQNDIRRAWLRRSGQTAEWSPESNALWKKKSEELHQTLIRLNILQDIWNGGESLKPSIRRVWQKEYPLLFHQDGSDLSIDEIKALREKLRRSSVAPL